MGKSRDDLRRKGPSRSESLEKQLSEVNVIVDGSESKFWQIIGKIIKDMADEAVDAFHTTNIDNVDTLGLLRQFISQRVKAKTCKEILGFVENAKVTKGFLEEELRKIYKAKGGVRP